MEALCGGRAAYWQRRGHCLVAVVRRRGRMPARASMEALSSGHAVWGEASPPGPPRLSSRPTGLHGGTERRPA
eukprot:12362592-Alexandrium_andersonii.AAC.1